MAMLVRRRNWRNGWDYQVLHADLTTEEKRLHQVGRLEILIPEIPERAASWPLDRIVEVYQRALELARKTTGK